MKFNGYQPKLKLKVKKHFAEKFARVRRINLEYCIANISQIFVNCKFEHTFQLNNFSVSNFHFSCFAIRLCEHFSNHHIDVDLFRVLNFSSDFGILGFLDAKLCCFLLFFSALFMLLKTVCYLSALWEINFHKLERCSIENLVNFSMGFSLVIMTKEGKGKEWKWKMGKNIFCVGWTDEQFRLCSDECK